MPNPVIGITECTRLRVTDNVATEDSVQLRVLPLDVSVSLLKTNLVREKKQAQKKLFILRICEFGRVSLHSQSREHVSHRVQQSRLQRELPILSLCLYSPQF